VLNRKRASRTTRLEVDKMEFSFDKNRQIDIFKSLSDIGTLHYHFKLRRRGAWVYLSREILDVLGIDGNQDGELLFFVIDDSDIRYNFLILVKSDFLTERLRPLLFDLKFKSTTAVDLLKKLAEARGTAAADVYIDKGDTNATF